MNLQVTVRQVDGERVETYDVPEGNYLLVAAIETDRDLAHMAPIETSYLVEEGRTHAG